MAQVKRGRPKVHDERITTAVRLPKGLHKRLKIEAVYRDVGVNVIVTKAVEDWMKKNEGKVRL